MSDERAPSVRTAARQRPMRRALPSSRPGEPFPLKPGARAELPVEREIPRASAFALVGALTLVGAGIRIADTHGLSVEEIRNLDEAHRSLGSLLAHLVHRGVAPPLQPVLDWLTVRLLGDGDFAIRFPSLVAGVLLIPAGAWLARELFDRTTAVVAALFVAAAPILVWYSQEASAYALTALFGTLTVLGAVQVVRHGRPADWALHTAAAALTVWSNWAGIFVVTATELVLLLELVHRRRIRAPSHDFLRAWAISTLALACQLGPLGLLFAFQLHGDGGLAGVTTVSASGVSFNTAVSNLCWALVGFHSSGVTTAIAAAWPLAMLTSLLLLGRGTDRRFTLLLVCGLIPPLGVLALGFAVPGAFDVRYGLAAVPPLFLLFARMTTAWPGGRTARWLIIAAMVIVLGGALVDQQIDPSNPRVFDYRQALEQVRKDAGPRAAIFYDPANLRIVLAHFAPGLHASRLTRHLPTRSQAGSVFVIASGADQGAPLALRFREIGALHATRKLVSYDSYPGVQVWWFR
jgi:Dolichyl-phosphate-mannose-protein mannosyltransferase